MIGEKCCNWRKVWREKQGEEGDMEDGVYRVWEEGRRFFYWYPLFQMGTCTLYGYDGYRVHA